MYQVKKNNVSAFLSFISSRDLVWNLSKNMHLCIENFPNNYKINKLKAQVQAVGVKCLPSSLISQSLVWLLSFYYIIRTFEWALTELFIL